MIHKREVGPVYVFENYLTSSFLPPLTVQMFTMVYVLVNKLGGSNIGIIKHDRLLGGGWVRWPLTFWSMSSETNPIEGIVTNNLVVITPKAVNMLVLVQVSQAGGSFTVRICSRQAQVASKT